MVIRMETMIKIVTIIGNAGVIERPSFPRFDGDKSRDNDKSINLNRNHKNDRNNNNDK